MQLAEEKKVHDVRVNAVYVIGIIGVAMVTISQFTDIYYSPWYYALVLLKYFVLTKYT